MRKFTFPRVMKSSAAFFGILMAAFALADHLCPRAWLVGCAITFGTFFYHFAMRLAVGALIPNRFDPYHPWFRPRPWEARLYGKLGIKRWKNRLPTYDPELFSTEHYTPEQICRHMCQAEIVHEVIVLCSFIPLLLAIPFGAFPVFLITSCFSAAADTLFVLLQRYNRPRLLRLLEKKARRAQPTTLEETPHERSV